MVVSHSCEKSLSSALSFAALRGRISASGYPIITIRRKDQQMTTPRTYTGGCHCGKVRYEVTTALEKVMSCNCSICSKRGWLLSFVGADQFNLIQGGDGLTDYQFGKKHTHHLFCPECGVASFARGSHPQIGEMIAVNVRCLDDVDISALQITQVDGKSL
jgi:hypothetical protein